MTETEIIEILILGLRTAKSRNMNNADVYKHYKQKLSDDIAEIVFNSNNIELIEGFSQDKYQSILNLKIKIHFCDFMLENIHGVISCGDEYCNFAKWLEIKQNKETTNE